MILFQSLIISMVSSQNATTRNSDVSFRTHAPFVEVYLGLVSSLQLLTRSSG